VVAIDGTRLSLGAESLCLHGDTPGAVPLAEAILAAFLDAGVNLASFVSVSIATGARA
jgi:UPF0271 protein